MACEPGSASPFDPHHGETMNEKGAESTDFKYRDAASYDDVTDAFEKRGTGEVVTSGEPSAVNTPRAVPAAHASRTGAIVFSASPRTWKSASA